MTATTPPATFTTGAVNVEPGTTVVVDSLTPHTATVTEGYRGLTAIITEVVESGSVLVWRTNGGRHFATVDAAATVDILEA
jgi:hypothetical protein